MKWSDYIETPVTLRRLSFRGRLKLWYFLRREGAYDA